MAPTTRAAVERRNASDHDLLVRIDEKLISLTNSVKENTEKTEAKLDRLWTEKADKNEIAEIKQLLEEKLPKESFDSVQSPIKDHEGRIRQLERIAYRAGGAFLLAQTAFNIWLAKHLGGG